MNKSDLIAAIAAKTGDTKKSAEETVNAFVDVVTEALVKGDKVQLVGFGSFEKYQHQKLQYLKQEKL